MVAGVNDKALGWSKVTSDDLETLTAQLGRKPSAVLAVARRCFCGRPQVIVNDPLPAQSDGKPIPFPTLFWLTCPYLVKSVDRLEAAGWIARLREELMTIDAVRQMSLAHKDHARLRLALCNPEDLDALRQQSPSQYQVIAESGVAGMRNEDGVKCLHAHLADLLGRCQDASRPTNPLGQKTLELLKADGVDIDGSKSCDSCGPEKCV